jgi:hypothetical protein
MIIDICNWQADGATGVNIQVEVDTARSAADAKVKYTDFLAAIVTNTAPGATPANVPNLGNDARTVGQWIIAYHGTTVLTVSGAPAQGGQQATTAMLAALATDAAEKLHW